jgi:hypothetical protein
MALAVEPLPYCANVHAGATLREMLSNLERYATPLADRLGRPFAVGLWLPRSAVETFASAHAMDLAEWLRRRGFVCKTMNAFPFGDFHAARVKENVYLPDWSTMDRADYTCRVADLLVKLLPEHGEGSISTLPCAFKPLAPDGGAGAYFPMLMEAVRHLAWIKETTGKIIRLAIEPEPGCFLETTADAIRFFHKLWSHAANATLPQGAEDAANVKEHVGLCFDVCHAAVMQEDPAESIERLYGSGVRIVKVQLSSAIELPDPADAEARNYLTRFVEPRYLHQTTARHPSGALLFLEDLTKSHALSPPPKWLECPNWRVHFHVPLHRETMGPLQTTSPLLPAAIEAIRDLPYAPDLEVETYTWTVMPAEGETPADFDLVDGLAAELEHAYRILRRLHPQPC